MTGEICWKSRRGGQEMSWMLARYITLQIPWCGNLLSKLAQSCCSLKVPLDYLLYLRFTGVLSCPSSILQAALERAQKSNAELSASLADEKADRVLYFLKSQVMQLKQ